MLNNPGVYASCHHENLKPDLLDKDFIDNKYIPCEELFPGWMTAGIILKDFCAKVKEWGISGNENNLNISLEYPWVRDELSGEMVPQILFFPEEDIDRVISIIDRLQFDYNPNIDDCLYKINNEWIKNEILNRIKNYECNIIELGGRPILEELKFRLGIYF